MSSVNKVIIIGNLGQDPEIRYTQSGDPVASLSVATTRKWKNKQTNEQQEKTEWHRITIFGHSAAFAGEYLKKGSQVFIEGRLEYGSYEDKDGVKRYTTDIVANDVQILGSRDSGSGGDRGGQRDQGQRNNNRGGQREQPQRGRGYGQPSGQQAKPEPYDPGAYPKPGANNEDDIPF